MDNGVVHKLKEGYEYSLLNKKTGIILENSVVDEKTIIMGMATLNEDEEHIDNSIKLFVILRVQKFLFIAFQQQGNVNEN